MSGNLTAARADDQRVALVALRDTLAAAMDDADANMLPQLAGQYRATLKDLAELPEVKPASALEQAKQARQKRRGDLKAV